MIHSLFLVIEIFVGILFVFSCLNRRVGTPMTITNEAEMRPEVERVISSTPLKRRHSHEEQSVSLDNHQIKELTNYKRRRSLDRKFSKDFTQPFIVQIFALFSSESEKKFSVIVGRPFKTPKKKATTKAEPCQCRST